jgi:hypothetical protein
VDAVLGLLQVIAIEQATTIPGDWLVAGDAQRLLEESGFVVRVTDHRLRDRRLDAVEFGVEGCATGLQLLAMLLVGLVGAFGEAQHHVGDGPGELGEQNVAGVLSRATVREHILQFLVENSLHDAPRQHRQRPLGNEPLEDGIQAHRLASMQTTSGIRVAQITATNKDVESPGL